MLPEPFIYRVLGDLPAGIREKIELLAGAEAAAWIQEQVPALHDKSIIEMMNSVDGEFQVRAYLRRIEADSH